ncbi:xylulokinase [Gottschalkiaceae bacterium SANA]|nr:xylulokinase [Gottschalkiaceae bacterium SANA]
MEKYVAGIDVGTTGVKVMILDLKGNIAGKAYQEYPVEIPHDGWVEQDFELVAEKTFEVSRAAVAHSKVDPKDIKGIGIGGQRATVGFLDEAGMPIGNFMTWQDNRAITEMDYIKSVMDPVKLYQIEGQPITPTFSFEKLIWVKRNKPEMYKQIKKIVFAPDYILHKFGADEMVSEVTNAGCSGMMNLEERCWSKEIFDTYGLDQELVCPLVNPGDIVGYVTAATAKLCGFAEGTPLVANSGDNQLATLGVGVTTPGDACLTLGTSGVLIAATEKPVYAEDCATMVNMAASKDLYQFEGIQLGAASSYKWVRDTIADLEKKQAEEIQGDAFELMNKHVEKSAVGAGGVIFMPYLYGNGYPYWNPHAKSIFAGLKSSTTKSDMIRAVMEGISLESKDMYQHMQEAGIAINSLVLTGGASKSDIWAQIIADMLNLPVKRLKVSDATILGSAILTGVGVGLFEDNASAVKEMVHVADETRPIAGNVAIYEKRYSTYRNLYHALADQGIFEQL